LPSVSHRTQSSFLIYSHSQVFLSKFIIYLNFVRLNLNTIKFFHYQVLWLKWTKLIFLMYFSLINLFHSFQFIFQLSQLSHFYDFHYFWKNSVFLKRLKGNLNLLSYSFHYLYYALVISPIFYLNYHRTID
jgi:hypothetical protein